MASGLRRLLSLRLALTLACIPGCSTYGTITVSDPQVFTRERLVQERFEEYQWLAQQLGNYPKETKFQGLRDFREFSGVYNNLGVKFDPLQGNIDTLKQETEILNTQLEKRKAEKQLADFLEGNLEEGASGTEEARPTDAEQGTPTPPANNSAGSSSESNTTPTRDQSKGKLFQKVLDKDFKLPKGSEGEIVDAKKIHGGSVDLFHDQFAYRNTVRAAMREKQLDDSHDIFGSTLYDLQFDITLKPGDNSQQYAQVTLEIMDPHKDSDDAYHSDDSYYKEIYCEWVEGIQKQIFGKISQLQMAFISDLYSPSDVEYLQKAIDIWLPSQEKELVTYDLIEKEANTKNWNVPKDLENYELRALFAIKEESLEKLSRDSTGEKTDKFTPTDEQDKIARNRKGGLYQIRELIKFFRESRSEWHELLLDGQSLQDNKKFKNAILALISFAVLQEYQQNLNQYFTLNYPDLMLRPEDFSPESKNNYGIYVTGPEIDRIEQKREVCTDSLSKRVNNDMYENFRKKLTESKRFQASTVEPKEYAQNISDMAAREQLVAMVTQLSATLPQYGVSGENYNEYVRKTQEYVQAINRKPLVIGFGEGKQKFGWILGPKFAIANPRPMFWWFTDLFKGRSLVEFSHTPIRHSFRAAIVVPAWYEDVKLKVSYEWLDKNGDSLPMGQLRSDHVMTVKLPMPPEKDLAIIRALTRSSRDTQPEPQITYPDNRRNSNRNKLRLLEFVAEDPSTHRQTFLIQGKELWRNPEIYIDSFKASEVKITSDMDGVWAVFDFTDNADIEKKRTLPKLSTKNEVPLDLTVITSGGHTTVPGGVVYIPKGYQTPPEPSVSLASSFVAPGDQDLVFKYDAKLFPDSFYSLELQAKPANETTWWTVESKLNKDEKKKTITTKFEKFKIGDKTNQPLPSSIKASRFDLKLHALKTEGDKNPIDLLTPDKRSVVVFNPPEEGKPKLISRVVAFKREQHPTTMTWEWKALNGLKVQIPGPKEFQELFFKAYPDLKEIAERNDGNVKIRLDGGSGIGTSLDFPANYNGSTTHPEFEVGQDQLNRKVQDIPDGGPTEYSMFIEYAGKKIEVEGGLIVFK